LNSYGYSELSEALMIAEMIECLEWEEPFTLVAHSRGGSVCLAAAGAWPEKLKALIFLDSFMGWRIQGATLPAMLADCYDTEMKNRARKPRQFASFEEAVKHSFEHPWFPKSRCVLLVCVFRCFDDAKIKYTYA
jgi:pimeloyl-ACP methyl ester carboxylesterase